MTFPPCPPSLKQIQHFLKLAQEHDERDLIVSYWSRIYALQVGLKLSTQKSDETALLLALMDWLEGVKRDNADNECITNEVAAQAHLENYALKLFLYADKQDRAANFGKNVVKAFYSSGVIYDVLQTFGELSDEAMQNRKYAKWKAAYIHNCLKNGEIPSPGPMADPNDEQEAAQGGDNGGAAISGGGTDDGNDMPPNSSVTNPTPPPYPASPNNPFGGEQIPSFPNASPPHTTPPTVDEVLNNPEKLPSPPVEEEKPGGFEPYVPPAQPNPIYTPTVPIEGLQLTPEQMIKAQKYCKYAGSALNFDDVSTAIENLQKALRLLTMGQDS